MILSEEEATVEKSLVTANLSPGIVDMGVPVAASQLFSFPSLRMMPLPHWLDKTKKETAIERKLDSVNPSPMIQFGNKGVPLLWSTVDLDPPYIAPCLFNIS